MRGRPGQYGRMRDWVAWHREYDDPASSLSLRLERVRAHLSEAIASAPRGPIQVVSLCAGQGHDVLGVLPGHPRRDDVRALLVEADATNAGVAAEHAAAAGLTRVYVRQADASLVSNFADVLPADVLLLCGIFGNVSEGDIKRTVDAAAALCADGADGHLDPAPPPAGPDCPGCGPGSPPAASTRWRSTRWTPTG